MAVDSVAIPKPPAEGLVSSYFSGLKGIGFMGKWGQTLPTTPNMTSSDGAKPAVAASVSTVFFHQRPCYDGGLEYGFVHDVTRTQSPQNLGSVTSTITHRIYFYYSSQTNCGITRQYQDGSATVNTYSLCRLTNSINGDVLNENGYVGATGDDAAGHGHALLLYERTDTTTTGTPTGPLSVNNPLQNNLTYRAYLVPRTAGFSGLNNFAFKVEVADSAGTLLSTCTGGANCSWTVTPDDWFPIDALATTSGYVTAATTSGYANVVSPSLDMASQGAFHLENVFAGLQGPSAAYRDQYSAVNVTSYYSGAIANLGGVFDTTQSPSMNSGYDSRLLVFSKDQWAGVWANYQSPSSTWRSSWYQMPGAYKGSPSAATPARDPGSSQWVAWFAAKGEFTNNDPSAGPVGTSAYWLTQINPEAATSLSPISLGGLFNSDPAAAGSPDGCVYVVGGTDYSSSRSLWTGRLCPLSGGGYHFSGWKSLGGTVIGKPDVTIGVDGAEYICIRDTYSKLWMIRVTWDGRTHDSSYIDSMTGFVWTVDPSGFAYSADPNLSRAGNGVFDLFRNTSTSSPISYARSTNALYVSGVSGGNMIYTKFREGAGGSWGATVNTNHASTRVTASATNFFYAFGLEHDLYGSSYWFTGQGNTFPSGMSYLPTLIYGQPSGAPR